jgi:hypothetical protein
MLKFRLQNARQNHNLWTTNTAIENVELTYFGTTITNPNLINEGVLLVVRGDGKGTELVSGQRVPADLREG